MRICDEFAHLAASPWCRRLPCCSSAAVGTAGRARNTCVCVCVCARACVQHTEGRRDGGGGAVLRCESHNREQKGSLSVELMPTLHGQTIALPSPADAAASSSLRRAACCAAIWPCRLPWFDRAAMRCCSCAAMLARSTASLSCGSSPGGVLVAGTAAAHDRGGDCSSTCPCTSLELRCQPTEAQWLLPAVSRCGDHGLPRCAGDATVLCCSGQATLVSCITASQSMNFRSTHDYCVKTDIQQLVGKPKRGLPALLPLAAPLVPASCVPHASSCGSTINVQRTETAGVLPRTREAQQYHIFATATVV
jgi:hypothetical protein